MVDRPDSAVSQRVGGDGIAVPSDADWLNPFVTLSFAVAVTSRIAWAPGSCLLEHNRSVVAKQAASLDKLSRGRFVMGVGIGGSSEEFAALGVPFQGRARRTREYVDVMRTLWSSSHATYEGEFVRFDQVRSYPKPYLDTSIPVVLGGTVMPRRLVLGGVRRWLVRLQSLPGRDRRADGRAVGALSTARER